MSEYFVLPSTGQWLHSVRVDDETVVSEPVLGWLVAADGHHLRATPITRSNESGVVWSPDAGDEVELPDHVRNALDLAEVENETWTKPTSRWAER